MVDLGTWDRGLDYEQTRLMLIREIAWARHRAKHDKRARRRLAGLCVLLTQLDNAARVSEAHEAVSIFALTGQREVEVRVRKQRKDPEKRLVVIPPEVRPEDVRELPSLDACRMYAFRLGINTHSLRYARITDLALKKVQPQIIARITHHRKLDMLIRYTQEVAARELLRREIMHRKIREAGL